MPSADRRRFASLIMGLALSILIFVSLVKAEADAETDSEKAAVDPHSRKTPGDDIDMENAMYFYIKKHTRRDRQPADRCFVIEQGGNSVFHVHHWFPDAEEKENKIVLYLDPFQPEGRGRKTEFAGKITRGTRQSEPLHEKQGTTQFKIPKDGGMYKLCASATSQSHPHGLRLALVFDDGRGDDKLEQFKARYKLDEMQMKLVRLRLDVKSMLRDADYMSQQEQQYHRRLGDIAREVWWWPISQVVLLIFIGVYQVRHLQAFFQSKRLV